jgi:hypothetical protein
MRTAVPATAAGNGSVALQPSFVVAGVPVFDIVIEPENGAGGSPVAEPFWYPTGALSGEIVKALRLVNVLS